MDEAATEAASGFICCRYPVRAGRERSRHSEPASYDTDDDLSALACGLPF